MRIIGYIEHPTLKITVFKMDNKLSVKFETGLYEQTYKFRDGEGIEELADVTRLITPNFIGQVEQIFIQMHQYRLSTFTAQQTQFEETFEDII
ncbi:MAG: hypothetical protein KA974_05890 [Saprospiraceae bacterium]|nr:hypothetical protein [Saprospiraceae bacterium]MBP7679722.1 hypothetical protein [Saprospiraceae bacterium]